MVRLFKHYVPHAVLSLGMIDFVPDPLLLPRTLRVILWPVGAR